MELTPEQLVDLKKWAYQMALDLAQRNAGRLGKDNKQDEVDFKGVMVNALVIFQWVTRTETT